MHILFLLPDFPFPPSTGGRSKIFNELSYLSKRHKCDLLCFGAPDSDDIKKFETELPDVRVLDLMAPPSGLMIKIKALLNLFKLSPPSLAAFNDENYSREIARQLATENYDVIHYDIINMAQYLRFGATTASVHSPNDATSLVYTRLAQQTAWSIAKFRLLVSAALLRRYERKIYPKFTKLHVVTDVDANYLKMLDQEIDTCSIPIALDSDQLRLTNQDIKFREEAANDLRIVCTGYLGNSAIADGTRDFIVKVLPVIVEQFPNIKLVILGKDADESLLELMRNNENIVYTEWVKDFKHFILQASVVLAPDYSGAPGAKTRVLQAMGLSIPVIGTRSAFEGIPIVNGEHGVIYDSMEECACLFLDFLAQHQKCVELGEKGHDLVKKEFSLKAIGPRYEKMYLDAIKKFAE